MHTLPSYTTQVARYREVRDALMTFSRTHGSDDPLAHIVAPRLAAICWQRLDVEPRVPSAPSRSRLRRATDDLLGPRTPRSTGYERLGDWAFIIQSLNHRRSCRPAMERLDGRHHSVDAKLSLRSLRQSSERATSLSHAFVQGLRETGLGIPMASSELFARFHRGALGMAYAAAVFDQARPKCLVVCVTHAEWHRAALHEARARSIPSVYIPHAPVITQAEQADLPVDYAALRGDGEAAYYVSHGADADRLHVVGNPSIAAEYMPDIQRDAEAVFAPSPVRKESLQPQIDLVHAVIGKSVIVSPHPRSDIGALRAACPASWSFWSGRTYDLLRSGSPVLLQHSSGVGLEGIQLGIPTVDFVFPGRPPQYPPLTEPFVFPVSSDHELRAALCAARDRSTDAEWRNSLRRWSHHWNGDGGETAAIALAGLLRHAKQYGPSDSWIWNAWFDGHATNGRIAS